MPWGELRTKVQHRRADQVDMRRTEAANRLRTGALEIADQLAAATHWGSPSAEVRSGLQVVLDDIATGIEFSCSGLVDRGLAWWKVRVRALGGDPTRAERLPELLATIASQWLPDDQLPELRAVLANAGVFVRHAPCEAQLGAELHPSLAPGELAAQLVDALLAGDRIAVTRLLTQEGLTPQRALSEGLEPAMTEFGARWHAGMMPPNVEHVASRIAHEQVTRFTAAIPSAPTDAPTVALVRAAGDEHALGQACLQVHLAAAGLRPRVLPATSDVSQLVEMVRALRAGALAVSCTIAAQLAWTRELIATIRRAPNLAAVPVLVGGRMFADVPQMATLIGADGSAASGAEAADVLANLVAAAPR